jgi:hypothetical protein
VSTTVEPPRIAAAAMTIRSAVVAATLGVLVTIGFLGGHGTGSDAVPPTPVELGLTGAEHLLFERHRCSVAGFEDRSMPTQALVRHRDGRLEPVDLDRGWASFTGEAPGELIATCLGAH